MSWEWRVFWRNSEERKIILNSLGLEREPRAREIRSDTYICCTREVGIKWRRGRQLEFKVMTERDEKSMVEKWNKILVTSCPLSINDEEVRTLLINHIDKLLKKGNYRNQLENARETLLATPTLKLVEVHKERSDQRHNGCYYELTNITCSSPSQSQYQSLCVEGDRHHIHKFLTMPTAAGGKNMFQFFGEVGQFCGYPQFVNELYSTGQN